MKSEPATMNFSHNHFIRCDVALPKSNIKTSRYLLGSPGSAEIDLTSTRQINSYSVITTKREAFIQFGSGVLWWIFFTAGLKASIDIKKWMWLMSFAFCVSTRSAIGGTMEDHLQQVPIMEIVKSHRYFCLDIIVSVQWLYSLQISWYMA